MCARIEAGHQVHLIDTKNELEQIFRNHAHVYKPEDTVKLIRSMTQAAKDRMQLFSDTGTAMKRPIQKLSEYNEATGQNLPIIYIFIEEMILIMDMIDADELTELFVAGRSSGVYIYMAMQLLKADILPRKCSVNALNRVFMGSPDIYAWKVLYPGGVPAEIKAQATTYLGPEGHAMVFNSKTNDFKFKKFDLIPHEYLVDLMQ